MDEFKRGEVGTFYSIFQKGPPVIF